MGATTRTRMQIKNKNKTMKKEMNSTQPVKKMKKSTSSKKMK